MMKLPAVMRSAAPAMMSSLLSGFLAAALAPALLIMPGSAPAAAQEEKVLNVFNWSDYVAPDTIANFEKETGIKVNYDVYDSNDILETKISVGKSGYDVVFPSASPFFARQVKAGLYQKLDLTKIPNAKGVDVIVGRIMPHVIKLIGAKAATAQK